MLILPSLLSAWCISLGLQVNSSETLSAPLAVTATTDSPGWRLPPSGPVSRTTLRLVNYFHIDHREGRVEHRSERLAQWNVVILNHDLVKSRDLTLSRMRSTHPQVKILAWVPLQGPNNGLAPGVPSKGSLDWYARKVDGTYLVPHWGGNLMNPTANDHAWIRHVLQYIRHYCLGTAGYDGIMLDCLWPSEPGELDVNGDGKHDARDTQAWQDSMVYLLRQLRTEFPDTILVGNAGGAWPADCPYYLYTNGCMQENALGDEFGESDWKGFWESYRTALSKVTGRPNYHFVQVDVRAERRSQNAAAALTSLNENDRRRFRLGLATTLLLDGGYFGFDRGDCLHGQLWWFDEYDQDLGAPRGSFREADYGPGTLSRNFERGLVVVNPTQAAITVSEERGLRQRASEGWQRTIRVPPNDARILVRRQAEPAASR